MHPASDLNEKVWKASAHIPALDGIRGLAILVVTIYRFGRDIPTTNWAENAFHAAVLVGNSGVDLFFVLSGFLITGILVDARNRPYYLRDFFIRRSLRILPLYFVALVLFLVVIPIVYGVRHPFQMAVENQFYLWTYLTNVKMSFADSWCFGSLDHFWSLAVEEHFYLLWPFVIYFCSPRVSLRLALTLAAASALSRIAVAALTPYNVAPDVLTIFRSDALLIGSALALAARHPQALDRLRIPSLILLVATLIPLGCSMLIGTRLLTISYTLVALLCACLLVQLLTSTKQSWLARIFQSTPLRHLGKYSYAMYVFQSPLIPLLAPIVSANAISGFIGSNLLGQILYIAIMFTLTYAVALWSWYGLESHCQNLKVYLTSHAPNPAQMPCTAHST
jgi:peptidoglycan/LPS O-acetylase OafA/YrhL